MTGLPLDGTAFGGSDKDQAGTAALVLQTAGWAETAGPVGSRVESEWFEKGWNPRAMAWVSRMKTWGTPCHGQSRWCPHPGDQTRLEVAART